MNEPTIETLARRLEQENQRLMKVGVLTLFVIIAVVLSISAMGVFDSAFGAKDTWGVWTEKEGNFTYEFLKNHEFRFRGKTDATPPKTIEVEGVWETGSGICWVGQKGEGNTGNLMLYVGNRQCCLGARRLGENLVLSELWEKPSRGSSEFCNNRVLIKGK